MGSLSFFPIGDLARTHGCSWFCETGYGRGAGVEEAAKHPFKAIYSIELLAAVVAEAGARWQSDRRVAVVEGNSPDILREVLTLHPEPGLFWLDAHFPGMDTDHGEIEVGPDVNLPLQHELSLFEGRRGDVILIDDMRIYTGQTWEYDAREVVLGSTSVIGSLDLTGFICSHSIRRHLAMEGYIELLPL